jgi:hypothetical protein
MNRKHKAQLKKAIYIYGDFYNKCSKTLSEIIHYYSKEKGYKIAMWGGGLKGIAFLNLIDRNNEHIKYVFDIDKSKYNSLLPTGHTIVDYKLNSYQDVDVVLIMNNNFETEIVGMLAEVQIGSLIVNVDSIVCGELTKEEAIELYSRRSL